MKSFFNHRITLLLLTSLFLLNACTNNNKAKTQGDNEPSIESIIEETINSGFEDSFSPPSPDEVMAFFESTLIEFNPDLLNNVGNASNYFDSKSQALNLGIYLSDIAYMNLFPNTSEAIKYMETVFVLSEKLNISGAYGNDIIGRLMVNLDNQDSTLLISEQIYFSLIEYLLDNQRSNALALVSIGSYVEILHLSLSSIDKYDPNNLIIKQIADLNILLESIYNFADKNTSDSNVEKAFAHLQKIKSILDQTNETNQGSTQLSTDENKMLISGGTEYQISEETFNQLKIEVERIRNLIIQ